MVRDARSLRGAVYWRMNKIDEAAADLQSVLRRDPAHVPSLYGMFLLSLHRHDVPRAEEFFAKIQKVDPTYEGLAELKKRLDEERSKAAVLTGNYGEAGAIDLFGPKYGLPPAISGHQTYFFWGPRSYTGEVIITLQYDRTDLEPHCASVQDAGAHYHPWGMAEENAEIYICRGLKQPLSEVWPRVKHWN